MVESDANDKLQASSHCTSNLWDVQNSYNRTLFNSVVVYHSFLISDTCDPAWAHFSKVLKLFGRIAGDIILLVSSK